VFAAFAYVRSSVAPPLDAGIWQGIFLGAVIAFYAFIGFEDMANVAEEVKRPERDLPRAILLSLLIVTVIYGAVAYVAVTAIPLADLAQSNAPMALVYARTTGESPAGRFRSRSRICEMVTGR